MLVLLLGSHPYLIMPAMVLSLLRKTQTMGERWWYNKLRKYHEVREKIKANKQNADDVAAIEMRRLERDEAREKRIKDREDAIKQEPSAIKRVLLNARQVADEFS